MILTDLQTYLNQRHHASLADLARHFHADADTLRAMLHRLIRKGRVRALPVVERCHGCTACHAAELEIYEWIGTGRQSDPERAIASAVVPSSCSGAASPASTAVSVETARPRSASRMR